MSKTQLQQNIIFTIEGHVFNHVTKDPTVFVKDYMAIYNKLVDKEFRDRVYALDFNIQNDDYVVFTIGTNDSSYTFNETLEDGTVVPGHVPSWVADKILRVLTEQSTSKYSYDDLNIPSGLFAFLKEVRGAELKFQRVQSGYKTHYSSGLELRITVNSDYKIEHVFSKYFVADENTRLVNDGENKYIFCNLADVVTMLYTDVSDEVKELADNVLKLFSLLGTDYVFNQEELNLLHTHGFTNAYLVNRKIISDGDKLELLIKSCFDNQPMKIIFEKKVVQNSPEVIVSVDLPEVQGEQYDAKYVVFRIPEGLYLQPSDHDFCFTTYDDRKGYVLGLVCQSYESNYQFFKDMLKWISLVLKDDTALDVYLDKDKIWRKS